MAGSLEVGDRAPDFSLHQTRYETVSLSDTLKNGKVVLVFYFFDWSGPWRNELSQFRDKAADFEQAGAQILAINIDSIFSHQAFAKDLDVKYPLLSDFNREVVPSYVGYYENALGFMKEAGRRAVFVLDRNGVVQYKWMGPPDDPGVLPSVTEVLEAVRSMKV